MTHAGFIQSLVTHHLFQSILEETETFMFYVPNVITFNTFLELLWNPTLNLYVIS